MSINYTTLILEESDDIIILKFNRPEVSNAVNLQMLQELYSFWSYVNCNSCDKRCIILTGVGRSFCAGADLKERHNISVTDWKMRHQLLQNIINKMQNYSMPIIAAINGAAFGGGLEFVMLCDFAYAATTATFSQSEVKRGIIPGAMGTQLLPRSCGLQRAKELCYTGTTFSAKEACEWGIINKVCSPESLIVETTDVAKKIAANPPFAIQQAKKALNMSQNLDIKNGYLFEIEAYNQLIGTKDCKEGIEAFNEKRQPIFSNS